MDEGKKRVYLDSERGIETRREGRRKGSIERGGEGREGERERGRDADEKDEIEW